jgi:hypothetical protein
MAERRGWKGERERQVEIMKREEIERKREGEREIEREGERERIVWERWMSSLGMLGRRGGGREIYIYRREREIEKSGRGRERGIGDKE